MKAGTLLLSQEVQAICFLHKESFSMLTSSTNAIYFDNEMGSNQEIKIMIHKKKIQYFMYFHNLQQEDPNRHVKRHEEEFFSFWGVGRWEGVQQEKCQLILF